jgi:eukaryotic-like serine/threonine-protein kinase
VTAPVVVQIVQGDNNLVAGTGDIYNYQYQLPAAEADEWRDLLDLLHNVEQTWIKEELDPSVEGAELVEVGKEVDAKQVLHGMAKIKPESASPFEQDISSIFESARRRLLILGAAGSGKTTTLLELTRNLIRDVRGNARQPVPAIFHLSTWGETRQPLTDWLVGQLADLYFVPREQGRAWLERHRLFVLLDGLDEVRTEHQAGCVEAINAFIRDVGAPGVAVCCRTAEYASLEPVRLRLYRAVCLKPLTPPQIDSYLAAAGAGLEGLRTAVQGDPDLQSLARSPLLLGVMRIAYDGLPVHALATERLATGEQRRRHLFDVFVERMFARQARAVAPPYSRSQTVQWLSWQAKQMKAHSQTIFLVEQLQPSWLITRAERWTYTAVSRLAGGAALGLVLGSILALILGTIEGTAGGVALGAADFVDRVTFGLMLGLVDGLAAGLIDAWRFEQSHAREKTDGQRTPREVVADAGTYVLALGLVGWLLVSLVGRFDDLVPGLVFGLIVGLLFGLFFGLYDSRRGPSADIRTVEALSWSWVDARRSGGRGLLVGFGLGLLVGLLDWVVRGWAGEDVAVADRLVYGVLLGVIAGTLGAVVGTVFGGLKSGIVQTKARPNQGIELSVRNAVRSGLAIGATMGAVLGAAALLIPGVESAPVAGLVGGLFFGLLAALWDGGLDVVQHYTLRLMLAARDYTPLDYACFLDHAAGLAFLQEAGGGYLFTHRLLLEHFADQEPMPGPSVGAHPVLRLFRRTMPTGAA